MAESEDPGTRKVRTLLNNVHDGSYVIPYFQRGFEWEPSMVSELFESILQKYYTGLLLFWDLDEGQVEGSKWDPVWGAPRRNTPEKAILDGQQRLSSLYYAIYNPEGKFPSRKSYYVFYLDLIKVLNDDFDDPVPYHYFKYYRGWDDLNDKASWIESGQIPLPILSAQDPTDRKKQFIDSEAFDDWSEQFIEARSDDLPDGIRSFHIRDLFINILDYNFVHYPLSSDRKIRDICNIFAKVNASGMKLSTFDLMNAFLYPHRVELRKDLWERVVPEQLKKMDSNMNLNLLKIISLLKQNYCSSPYLYNLIPGEETIREEPDGTRYEEVLVESGDDFVSLWKQTVRVANAAREMIMNTGQFQFGAIRREFIPYGTILPVLGAILWEFESEVDDVAFKRTLNRWYWAAVFSKDYSGSSDTIMGRDFRNWKEWMADGRRLEQISKVDASFIDELDLKSEEKNSGRYNGIICLQALNGPRDFYEGNILGTGDFTEGRINDHHIFPKQVKGIEPEHTQTFSNYRDAIVNRTLILNDTNNQIKSKRPSVYLETMAEHHGGEAAVRDMLKDHFISDAAYDSLAVDDFDNFVIEREKEMKRQIIANIGIEEDGSRQSVN